MIPESDLMLVHYCYPDCTPLQNICRLPRDEAFALARELAEAHPETTAFYRFADFENYYPRRMAEDRRLYQAFQAKGGKPTQQHPLSFVLQGSDYLHDWFGKGRVLRLPLSEIPEEAISFTYGDSCATAAEDLLTKTELLAKISVFDTVDQFLKDLHQTYHYIEVQLWDDRYCVSIQG